MLPSYGDSTGIWTEIDWRGGGGGHSKGWVCVLL